MKPHIHLAFDLSWTHLEGRWRMPGSWIGRTYPDVEMYEEVARLAERGCIDMLFFGDGTGIPNALAGDAAEVADALEETFEATGSRGGFMVAHPQATPRDLVNIVDFLVPELRRRGRVRRHFRSASA